MTTTKTEQIRALNDRLRQHLNVNDGTAIITVGIAALGDEVVARIFRTIVVRAGPGNLDRRISGVSA